MLEDLPHELLIQILSYSKNIPVLFCLKQVSKKFYRLVTSSISIIDLSSLADASEELDKIIALVDFSVNAYKAALINRHVFTVNQDSVIKLARLASGKELDIIIGMANFNATTIASILANARVEIISKSSIAKLARLTNSVDQLNRIIRLIGFDNTATTEVLANENLEVSMLNQYSIRRLQLLTNNYQEWLQIRNSCKYLIT
ncbi:MAG: F-box protein [Gammaproteobacteria bacterium]